MVIVHNNITACRPYPRKRPFEGWMLPSHARTARIFPLAARTVRKRVEPVLPHNAGGIDGQWQHPAVPPSLLVFVIGGDPVTFGIVASLNRPGGNITGMTLSASETVAKRLGLMLELVPAAAVIAVLANPKNPISESQLTELRAAARKLDRQLLVLNASTESDFAAVSTDIDQHNVEDRKSTRLNSSHLGISYAVFCLKTK